MSQSTARVELLILGAGWTSAFLIPLLQSSGIPFAATSRNGREGTIPFSFDPSSENVERYKSLPDATTVLITFPVTKNVGCLVGGYNKTRSGTGGGIGVNWIQLGSTGSFIQVRALCSAASTRRVLTWKGVSEQTASWVDRHTDIKPVPRSVQETELFKHASATVLHLAGLWGGKRNPAHWVQRIAPNKSALAAKAGFAFCRRDLLISYLSVLLQGSLHLIHGEDVARSILAAHRNFNKLAGQRWCLTDLRVYDWWELVSSWAPSAQDGERDVTENPRLWVKQLMGERGIRAFPRPMEQLGSTLDSREFWDVVGIMPGVTLHSAVAYVA